MSVKITNNNNISFSVDFLDEQGNIKHHREYSINLRYDREYMCNDIEVWITLGDSPRF